MNPFQEMNDATARGEPVPAAVNPFRAGAEKLAAERADADAVAYAAAMMNPEPVKHRRGAKPGRLRITDGTKLGNAQYSHDRYGRELAAIEDGNAELRKLSGLDFEIDESEPRGLNYLTIEEVERAYEAIMLLHCMGLNFNIWYTCTWASVQVENDADVADAVERHIVSLRKWMGYRGEGFHYIWVIERGENRGLHMHVLLHLPKKIPLKKLARQISQSIFTITGMYPRRPTEPPKPPKPPRKGKRSKPAKPIDPSSNPFAGLDIEAIDQDDTKTVHIEAITSVSEQWYLWQYMMKGVDHEEEVYIRGRRGRPPERVPLARHLGLKRSSHEGRYNGLRFGRSQTLALEAWDAFKAKHGMPRKPFWTADNPAKLYGSQFLDFARALANPKPKPKPPKISGLDSLGDLL